MVDHSPSRPVKKSAFKTPAGEARFFAAYDAVLRSWPVDVETVDIPSAYGTTRVNVCGPESGTPLVLLHGGGSTSTVWFANVADLSATHRVYAVDQIGGPGRSVHDGKPMSGLGDLMAWLDGVFVHCGLDVAYLCGHSYGGWLALNYARHTPHRICRLALLDPTTCFAGFRVTYLLHAAPMLVRPSTERVRAFFAWETGNASMDPAWLDLMILGATEFPSSKVGMPRRPKPERLRASTVPTLLLLAENSKSHDIGRVAANARRLMPHAVTAVLPGVSHHGVPMVNPAPLNRQLLDFFV